MKVTVLGAGSWGTTLALLLDYNGHEVTLWEYQKTYAKALIKNRENKVFLPGIKIPNSIKISNSLSESIKNRHIIVIAVPTQYIRSVLKKFDKLDFSETTFISVSKGIEKGTLLTVSQIIEELVPGANDSNIGVLSGPSHAEEVSKKIPTAVVGACKDYSTAKLIQAVFITSYFRVYTSTDIIGVELGGALKNIIAIGAGIVEGAKFGDNTKAAIMTRGIAEISRLGIALGANPKTFSGLSGMGDVIVTCMSKHSRNRYVGEKIGAGIKLKDVLSSMKMVAEGVETTRSVYELAAKNHVEVPIVDAVYGILFENKDPQKITYKLMTRDVKAEH
jgi:glycerol-3-phosphate dehydrogenase (NAD(P)+)